MPHKDCKLGLFLAMIFVLCATTSTSASIANASAWKNLGEKTIYFLGTDCCPVPDWLRRKEQMTIVFAKPNSTQATVAFESLLEKALQEYEKDSFILLGRIVLDKNPRCILGLYLAEKLPDTKLGNAGEICFEQCIEQSCLVVFGADPNWKKLLEATLIKPDKDSINAFRHLSFDEAEIPFLLIYLTENGSSENIMQRAREQLANYLLERYALKSALNQYRLLLLSQEYADISDKTQLRVAQIFEQLGAISDAEILYGKILRNTNDAEIAATAAEELVNIKAAALQEVHAWKVLNVLYRRFPELEASTQRTKGFFAKFEVDRERRTARLIERILNTQREQQALDLCRESEAFWSEEDNRNESNDAFSRWQDLIERGEPGSPAWQCGRLYLARALLEKGRTEESKNLLEDLYTSASPAIQARTLLCLADLTRQKGNIIDAIVLYQQAAMIARETALPEAFKTFQSNINKVDMEKLTAKEQDFFIFLLRGYNELIDGNFRTGILDLLRAKELYLALPYKSIVHDAAGSISSMLMLAYLNIDDCVRAEQYGLEAVRTIERERHNGNRPLLLTLHIERVDRLLSELSRQIWTFQNSRSRSQLKRDASKVYIAIEDQKHLNPQLSPTNRTLVQLFWQIKRKHVARILSAEYNLAKTRLSQTGNPKELFKLEPIIFTAQLLQEDSIEPISKNLIAFIPPEYRNGLMYRLAKFARDVKQPYISRIALDIAVNQVKSAGDNIELLENIADMYLTENNHHKAIEIYQRIVREVPNEASVEKARLNIIRIYAEHLKLYDEAIEQCHIFLKNSPDSPYVSNVEFLIGKLAYLTKDYIGAVGQLDRFKKIYPDSPNIINAMMLTALSQMSRSNTDDAIKRFAEIIEKNPKGKSAARSKFLIGYVQVSDQKYSQAIETFRQFIEQFPESKYTGQARGFIDRLSKVTQ